jgi:hypothetical protein
LMFFNRGIRQVIGVVYLLRDAYNLIVMMDCLPLVCHWSSMTGYIIVLRMFMLLTPCRLNAFRRQFGALPVPLLSRYPEKAVLTNCSFLLLKRNR